ncbi:hypothetical protein CerSpe_110260 [Prunus speciosa]
MQTSSLMESVAFELEGTLLKDPDPFSYFMLVAFEASGLIWFALLLMVWKVFSSYDRRVVVTKMPRVMVERFAKEHLTADEVIGKKSRREVEKKERKKKRKRGKKKDKKERRKVKKG